MKIMDPKMKNPFKPVGGVISRSDIKQVFFSCGMKDPEGMYADEVDIYEFAERLLAYALPIAERTAVMKERAACVEFVRSLNTLVGDKLEEKRG